MAESVKQIISIRVSHKQRSSSPGVVQRPKYHYERNGHGNTQTNQISLETIVVYRKSIIETLFCIYETLRRHFE